MWVDGPNEEIFTTGEDFTMWWYDEGADEEYWDALMENEPLDEYGGDELE